MQRQGDDSDVGTLLSMMNYWDLFSLFKMLAGFNKSSHLFVNVPLVFSSHLADKAECLQRAQRASLILKNVTLNSDFTVIQYDRIFKCESREQENFVAARFDQELNRVKLQRQKWRQDNSDKDDYKEEEEESDGDVDPFHGVDDVVLTLWHLMDPMSGAGAQTTC